MFNHIKTFILARVLILNKGQANKPNKPIKFVYSRWQKVDEKSYVHLELKDGKHSSDNRENRKT